MTDTVKTNYAVDLRLVSDITGAPVQEIEGLNPSLLRMSTPPDDEYDLRLPAGTAACVREGYRGDSGGEAAVLALPPGAGRGHAGESGADVACVASELAYVNQLKPGADLDSVDSVIIPQAPTSEGVLRATFYKARRGDTLVTIADRFGVTVEQLRRWNHVYRGTAVTTGRKMYVSEPARLSGLHYGRKRRGASKGQKTSTKMAEHQTTKKRPQVAHK